MNTTDLRSSGYALLENFLSANTMASAAQWISRAAALDEVPAELEPEYETNSRKLRKLRRLFWWDTPFWKQWLEESQLAKLAREVVGPRATLIRHASFLKPAHSGSAVVPHQDQALWSLDYPGAHSFWIPFVDTTRENGCLTLWPGSHQRGRLDHTAEHGDRFQKGCSVTGLGLTPVECPMPAGSVLIWERYMIHASGSNSTDQDRVGMVLVFADAGARHFYSRDRFELTTS